MSHRQRPMRKDDADYVCLTGPNTCTGTVRIGTLDLHDVDVKWWRSKIGLVQQEPFLFNDTLFNNVAFGLCGTQWQDLSKEEKMKMVKEACKEAYADEFIDRLPQGYDTMVGESGIKLSGEFDKSSFVYADSTNHVPIPQAVSVNESRSPEALLSNLLF